MLLRALGQLSLRARDGREVDAILKRPKALGVLLYLTVAEPRSFHRRDKLLALFWPDLDDQRGRHALRQTCYTLRRALPKTVLGRGSEELCVAPPGAAPVLSDPMWSPDGSRLVFVNAALPASIIRRVGGRVWEVSADGGEARALTGVDVRATAPTWAPDGQRLAFSRPIRPTPTSCGSWSQAASPSS